MRGPRLRAKGTLPTGLSVDVLHFEFCILNFAFTMGPTKEAP